MGLAARRIVLAVLSVVPACRGVDPDSIGSFDDDVEFVSAHTDVVVLGEAGGARVLVAPEYQGRVLTSTTGGEGGGVTAG
ncbi:MAG: DUF6786 family protein [Planctomycetota bacterium JB042]